jgi:Zn-dependent protease
LLLVAVGTTIADRPRQVTPSWGPGLIWIAALITAVLFFVTLLLHELAHSLVAQARGLKVRAITLFALGGVSQSVHR